MYAKKKKNEKNLSQETLLIPIGYDVELFTGIGNCYYSENGNLKDLPCYKCMFKDNNKNCFFYEKV